jgi:hypothetical protein
MKTRGLEILRNVKIQCEKIQTYELDQCDDYVCMSIVFLCHGIFVSMM